MLIQILFFFGFKCEAKTFQSPCITVTVRRHDPSPLMSGRVTNELVVAAAQQVTSSQLLVESWLQDAAPRLLCSQGILLTSGVSYSQGETSWRACECHSKVLSCELVESGATGRGENREAAAARAPEWLPAFTFKTESVLHSGRKKLQGFYFFPLNN